MFEQVLIAIKMEYAFELVTGMHRWFGRNCPDKEEFVKRYVPPKTVH